VCKSLWESGKIFLEIGYRQVLLDFAPVRCTTLVVAGSVQATFFPKTHGRLTRTTLLRRSKEAQVMD